MSYFCGLVPRVRPRDASVPATSDRSARFDPPSEIQKYFQTIAAASARRWRFFSAASSQRGSERLITVRALALPIAEKSVAHLPKLPLIHRDPFDRLLMCQSIEHTLTIATSDAVVRKYPVRTLWLA